MRCSNRLGRTKEFKYLTLLREILNARIVARNKSHIHLPSFPGDEGKHPAKTARGSFSASGGLISVPDGRAPIPWQQFVEPLDGMLGDARENVGEPVI